MIQEVFILYIHQVRIRPIAFQVVLIVYVIKYQYRSNKMSKQLEKAERYLRSAGMSFFVYRIEEILLNINNLTAKEEKSRLIKKYFENQDGYFDKNIGGTRTRVYSVIKIIEENNVEYVLNKIIKSKKASSDIITKAKKILEQHFKNDF